MNEFGNVLTNVSLKKYTTMKVGGNAKYLVEPFDKECLINLIKYLNDKKIKYYLIGNGSNIIFCDDNFDGVIIKLTNFKDISINDNLVTVGAGVNVPFFVNTMLNDGYVNFAFASGIPGNIGGSIVGNAGCYGHEFMQYFKCATVLDKNGDVKELSKDEVSFGYRYTSLKGNYIVLDVTFFLEEGDTKKAREEISENTAKRLDSQPLDKCSCGSIFRNPDGYSSGKLIDDLGLKGFRVGGAMISNKHANFLINEDNASYEDISKVIKEVKDKVKDKYDISLVLEPSIVTWDNI